MTEPLERFAFGEPTGRQNCLMVGRVRFLDRHGNVASLGQGPELVEFQGWGQAAPPANATATPIERAPELGTRRAYTTAEAAAIQEKALAMVAADAAPSDPNKKIEAGALPPVGNYNLFWTDRGMSVAVISDGEQVREFAHGVLRQGAADQVTPGALVQPTATGVLVGTNEGARFYSYAGQLESDGDAWQP